MARQPFSEETVAKILPLIDNTDFVRELGNDLKKIFEVFLYSIKVKVYFSLDGRWI